MISSRAYTTLTSMAIAAIVATLAWITFAPSGFVGAPIAMSVIIVLVYLTLAGRTNPGDEIWVAAEPPAQHIRLMVLILVLICLQFLSAVILQRLNQLDFIKTTLLSTVVWTLCPLLALKLGLVRWPKRVGRPRQAEVLAISAIAITIAVAFCALTMASYADVVPRRLPGGLPADIAAVAVGATMEEIVFRVLLLTALMAVTGSRFKALVLSATIFAACHVPTAVAAPIAMLDWGVAADYLRDLAPQMVWKIGFGLLLGALWIRTGSLTLVAAFHAIANMGPVWKAGFGALTGDA